MLRGEATFVDNLVEPNSQISAHSFGPNPATVYVDDVAISDKPID